MDVTDTAPLASAKALVLADSVDAGAGEGAAPGTGMLLRSGAWLLLVATTVVVGATVDEPGMGMLDRSGAWLLETVTTVGAGIGVGPGTGMVERSGAWLVE